MSAKSFDFSKKYIEKTIIHPIININVEENGFINLKDETLYMYLYNIENRDKVTEDALQEIARQVSILEKRPARAYIAEESITDFKICVTLRKGA